MKEAPWRRSRRSVVTVSWTSRNAGLSTLTTAVRRGTAKHQPLSGEHEPLHQPLPSSAAVKMTPIYQYIIPYAILLAIINSYTHTSGAEEGWGQGHCCLSYVLVVVKGATTTTTTTTTSDGKYKGLNHYQTTATCPCRVNQLWWVAGEALDEGGG
ncbi:hypothetical protein E2C01_091329 [Portunus trituberculatus]|uniref:Uncharacterized protein n=1 Tax=Portunus trituberculatus TaxID=210409 RepID=A0A5B7JDP5_PORTR|nr:hypothetical protein [Portunus trituberculatus]